MEGTLSNIQLSHIPAKKGIAVYNSSQHDRTVTLIYTSVLLRPSTLTHTNKHFYISFKKNYSIILIDINLEGSWVD